jgi:hypothetical protein
MPDITLKDVMAYFDTPTRPMTAKEMTKEWKHLSPTDKAQIKQGIEDGTLTY